MPNSHSPYVCPSPATHAHPAQLHQCHGRVLSRLGQWPSGVVWGHIAAASLTRTGLQQGRRVHGQVSSPRIASRSHTHARTHTNARMHTYVHARTDACTHTRTQHTQLPRHISNVWVLSSAYSRAITACARAGEADVAVRLLDEFHLQIRCGAKRYGNFQPKPLGISRERARIRSQLFHPRLYLWIRTRSKRRNLSSSLAFHVHKHIRRYRRSKRSSGATVQATQFRGRGGGWR